MKWRGFGSESPSGLHCTNRYWSTDHPMDQSSNRQCIGFITSTNSDRIRVSPNGSETLWHATIHTRWYTNTYVHIHVHIYVYTNTHNTHMHVHGKTHAYTLTPTSHNKHKLTHTHNTTHTLTHTHASNSQHIIYTLTNSQRTHTLNLNKHNQ